MYSGRPSVVGFDAYFCLYLVEVLCTQVVRLAVRFDAYFCLHLVEVLCTQVVRQMSVLTSISVCT